MVYEPRSITFLGSDGRLEHYGVARHDLVPRPALVGATRRVAHEGVPDGVLGFAATAEV